MERLTQHSKNTGSAEPSKTLGDLCLPMNFCDEFDFCEGCPVNTLLTRLCEYEDTGLTPTQISNMKKIRQHGKCQRKQIVGIPKSMKIITYGFNRKDVAKAIKQISKLSHQYRY